jgi:hypothetical protein
MRYHVGVNYTQAQRSHAILLPANSQDTNGNQQETAEWDIVDVQVIRL